MVVSHYPDGHYQIVGPPSPPNPLDDWMFSFQVPPLFLWWSAKHVVIATLLADVLFTIIFLFNATDLFSCILLVSVSHLDSELEPCQV
uniref:N-acetyltransferase domain-containing protein 1 n=1 Tax=Caenorhabditis japonica TaxID=281687 RepID=A0A8R1ENH5_CAEJA